MPAAGHHLTVGGRRRTVGLLGRVPGSVGLATTLLGAFLLGRGHGPAAIVVALALLAVGALSLQAWRVRLQRERDHFERAAYTDPLTGLSNRRMLLAMARHEIKRHLRHDGRFVVLMLDLDGFKQVNDRLGHEAGDRLLCAVADALTDTLRAQDTVARLGGDEFCVIAPETHDPRTLVNRVTGAVSEVVGGSDALTATVGVSLFPEDGVSTDKLLRMADDRLIAAKRRRHGRSRRATVRAAA